MGPVITAVGENIKQTQLSGLGGGRSERRQRQRQRLLSDFIMTTQLLISLTMTRSGQLPLSVELLPTF